jgi:hypothetical protein
MSVANILVGGRISPASLPIWSGTVTLVAGVAQVSIPNLPANVIVLLQYVTVGSPPLGGLGASNIANAGTPTALFNILCEDNTDVSQVKYVVMSLP